MIRPTAPSPVRQLVRGATQFSKKIFLFRHLRGILRPANTLGTVPSPVLQFPFDPNQHQNSNPPAAPDFEHPEPQTVSMNTNQTKPR
jgi:hypothetical protein